MSRSYFDPWPDARWPQAQARVRSPRPEPLRPAWARPVAAPAPEPPPPPSYPNVEEVLESVPHTVPPPAPEPVDKAQLRQALADLEGAKARVERDAERAREDAKAGVVLGMLPILDNLDRSIAAAGDSPDRALLEGIELVRAQFEDALARYGLERIESVGAPFDPSVHDAVGMAEVVDPAEDGVVIDEWQRGYRFGGRVVRAPKVRVGRVAQPNRG